LSPAHSIGIAALAAAGLLVSPLALSQNSAEDTNRPGFYIGAGAGTSTFKDEPPELNGQDFDEDEFAWKVFAGYRVPVAKILDLAVEGTYRDFGNPDATVSGSVVKYDTTGWDISGLAIVPLGPFDLFARGGYGWYDVTKHFSGVEVDDDKGAWLYGLGAGFRIWRFSLRAEWERFEIESLDHIDTYMLSAYFRF
jgi:opacity protein-like surface antigen